MFERPSIIQERIALVEANTAKATRKYPAKQAEPEADFMDGIDELLSSVFDLPPIAYSPKFLDYLGKNLRQWLSNEVIAGIEKLFPEFDTLDSEYLDDLLDRLQSQKSWVEEKVIGNDVLVGGGKRFKANLPIAQKWVKQQHLRLSQPTSILIEASLPFNRPVSHLADLIYRLEREGVISLQEYRNQNGNMAALCRTICRVFPPTGSSSENPAQALQLALAKIKHTELGAGPTSGRVIEALGTQRLHYESDCGNAITYTE